MPPPCFGMLDVASYLFFQKYSATVYGALNFASSCASSRVHPYPLCVTRRTASSFSSGISPGSIARFFFFFFSLSYLFVVVEISFFRDRKTRWTLSGNHSGQFPETKAHDDSAARLILFPEEVFFFRWSHCAESLC